MRATILPIIVVGCGLTLNACGGGFAEIETDDVPGCYAFGNDEIELSQAGDVIFEGRRVAKYWIEQDDFTRVRIEPAIRLVREPGSPNWAVESYDSPRVFRPFLGSPMGQQALSISGGENGLDFVLAEWSSPTC